MSPGCAVFLSSADIVREHHFILALPVLLARLRHWIGRMPRGAAEWVAERIRPAIAFIAAMATPTFGFASLPHEVYFPRVQGSGLRIMHGLALRDLLPGDPEDLI